MSSTHTNGTWVFSFVAFALFLVGAPTLAAQGEDPDLVTAVLRGDAGTVRELLQNNGEVNDSQVDGTTALMLAAERGDMAMIEMLLSAGASVNHVNEFGATALSVASASGGRELVRRLLEAGADPDAALLSGETPLMTAVDNGNSNAVRVLLDHGSNVNATESNGGQSVLMWAAAGQHGDIVKTLLAHGADIQTRSKGDFSALLFAAQQGDVETGSLLLDSGADVNNTWQAGPMSALMIASAGGHYGFSTLLLDRGADPDLTDARGYTALHHAALDPTKVKLLEALIAGGAQLDPRTTRDSPRNTYSGVSMKGATPLFLAASTGNVKAVRALIAGGADPFLTTDDGTAPLHVGAGVGPALGRFYTERMKRDALEIVRLLVELGADVNAAGEHAWTALHGAAYMGIDPVIQYLVDQGADLDVFDEYGQTPLSIANAAITVGVNDYYYQSSRIVHQSTVDLLLKSGATPLEDSGVQILSNFYRLP